jgi:hypothetical protein
MGETTTILPRIEHRLYLGVDLMVSQSIQQVREKHILAITEIVLTI